GDFRNGGQDAARQKTSHDMRCRAVIFLNAKDGSDRAAKHSESWNCIVRFSNDSAVFAINRQGDSGRIGRWIDERDLRARTCRLYGKWEDQCRAKLGGFRRIL